MILVRRVSAFPMRSQLHSIIVAAILLAIGALVPSCKGGRTKHDVQPSKAEPAAHTHAVARETCLICDPSKRDAGRLWCKEHGRYEDRCWKCQPQLRDPERAYCEEHGLYEDECFLCDPSRVEATPATGKAVGGGAKP